MPTIKGGESQGVRLRSGQRLQVVNTHGSQVVDLFAHNAADLGEALSIHHSRKCLVPAPAPTRRPALDTISTTDPHFGGGYIAGGS